MSASFPFVLLGYLTATMALIGAAYATLASALVWRFIRFG